MILVWNFNREGIFLQALNVNMLAIMYAWSPVAKPYLHFHVFAASKVCNITLCSLYLSCQISFLDACTQKKNETCSLSVVPSQFRFLAVGIPTSSLIVSPSILCIVNESLIFAKDPTFSIHCALSLPGMHFSVCLCVVCA